MKILTTPLMVALLTLAMPLAGTATAAPAQPTVQIQTQAVFMNATRILVDVTASCVPDAGFMGTVSVFVNQDPNANGYGDVDSISCDGERHVLPILIVGLWTRGDALARAQLFVSGFPGSTPSDQEFKLIHIN
jgi:hypothetical protein